MALRRDGTREASDDLAASSELPIALGSASEDALALGATAPAVSASSDALALDATLAAPADTAPRSVRTTVPPTLTPEQAARYRRGRELGRGGMGRVVLAIDEHLGREVAMKELHRSPAGDDVGAVLRFLREARVTGQLEHPSIVPVHELGRAPDGTFFYTMKRIRGRSLAAALREAPALPERLRLLGHFRDVCEAVAYAHARGVVHRDLKPDNVMVGEFGETLVVDWGIAKVRGTSEPRDAEVREALDPARFADAAQTVAGYAIGTPAYMSPEQARGELDAIDERSDVWGLGAMLFEILTGRAPFVGPTSVAVLRAVLEDPPPRVRDVAPDAPPELAAIADRALARDPSLRYPAAKEVALEIAAWQDGAPVRAYQYTSLELVKRFVRRNRAASVAAAVIAIATVVTAIAMSWSYREALLARRTAETRALVAEAGRLDQLGHRPFAFALLRAAHALGGSEHEDELVRAGFYVHADEPQAILLSGHDARVAGVAFSPDGTRVATASNDGTVREWDPSTGASLRVLVRDGDRTTGSVAYSADGATLRTTADQPRVTAGDTLVEWDLRTGTPSRTLPLGTRMESIAWARSRAAIGQSDGVVAIFDLTGGDRRVVAEHGSWVRALAFSPDATRLATGTRDGHAWLVSLAREPPGPPPIEIAGVGGEVRALDWSPDEHVVAVALQSGSVVLSDTTSGAVVRTIEAHDAPILATRFSPDGTLLATASEDSTARVWDPVSGTLRFALPHRGRVSSVAFDPAGARLSTGEIDFDAALVWRPPASGGLVLHGHQEWVHDATFAPDGRSIASASRDATVRIWDAESGGQRHVLRGHEGSVYCVRYAADGSRLASAGRDGHVRIWDPETGALLRDIAAHDDVIYGLQFVESDRVVTVSVDDHVRVWNVRDGARVLERAEVRVRSVAVAEGWIATGGSHGTIRLSRLDDAEPPRELEEHTESVSALAFSRDARWLVSSSIDGLLLLWDVSGGDLERVVARLDRGLTDAAFSPDGRTVVTASDDSTVGLWDLESGRLVTAFTGHTHGVRSAGFSPSGDRIVSASADETVRVWPTARASVDAVVRATASLTNLRVCRGTVRVVPVVLAPGVDAVWADGAACAERVRP